MPSFLSRVFNIDWILFGSIIPLLVAGLLTMNSFVGDNTFFDKQLVWIGVSVLIFFIFSGIDFRFLNNSILLFWVFLVSIITLVSLLFLGSAFQGAQSWFDFGFFAFQPSDFIKLVTILILAKYFSKRHIAIANLRHIVVSGFYAFIFFLLVFLQGDFGSAIIIFMIWLGMVLVSGISKKHLLSVFLVGLIGFSLLWSFGFADYQKQRVMTFLNPLTDISGAGYNAYQSTIAVGSGELLGKGVGFGTQSRLKFLPEYQTDFVFSAFAEEWGFLGSLILFTLFFIVVWRILVNAMSGVSNFEILFGLGLAVMFVSHFILHVGIDIGLLPVTGTTIPFLSYGGSHLMAEFIGLGILMGMRNYRVSCHKDQMKGEFLGM